MSAPSSAPPSGLRQAMSTLNTGSLGVAIGFAITAALLFSTFFITPFVEILARTLFVAMVLLLAFIGVNALPERWLPRWLPRWALTLAVMAVAAPLATFAMYLMSVGFNVAAFWENPARMTGFMFMAGTALMLGMVIALAAHLREREAQAASQALRFELEKSRLERQALDARYTLLQAQVQPHFLFNTLANVQALVEAGSPRAPAVLKSLIAYLRAAVPRLDGRPTTLGDELALTRAYLELMQMRMPDRLAFSVRCDDDALRQRFPGMAVLTLVENAVRHGLDPSEEGGRIEVEATLSGARLRVAVSDSGVGLDPRVPAGTGLANLRARLAALFGDGARLELSERSPHGVLAEILIELPTAGEVHP
jgi:sensor histidine kinase YesM